MDLPYKETYSKVYENILGGRNTILYGIYWVGKKYILENISNNESLQTKYLGSSRSEYRFFFISTLDFSPADSSKFYIKLGEKIGLTSETHEELYENIRKEYIDKGLKPIILVSHIHRISDLKTLLGQLLSFDDIGVNFIFSSHNEIKIDNPLIKNPVYVKPFDFEQMKDFWNLLDGDKEIDMEMLQKVSGGHQGLIQKIHNYLKTNEYKDENELFRFAPVNDLCRMIVKHSYINNSKEHLKNIGSLTSDKNVFSSLVKMKIDELPKTEKVWIDENTSQIFINGEPIRDNLTLKELELIKLLCNKPGVIISKDEIAESFLDVGEDTEDIPSDWSIDKLISRLRGKIGKNLIVTVRNRGVKLDV